MMYRTDEDDVMRSMMVGTAESSDGNDLESGAAVASSSPSKEDNDEDDEVSMRTTEEIIPAATTACRGISCVLNTRTDRFVVSPMFRELLACLAFFAAANAVWLYPFQVNQRAIPYQFLESTGEYVRNQAHNESFQGETVPGGLHKLLLNIPSLFQFLLCFFFSTRRIKDAQATACVYLVALSLNELATKSIKYYVGYLRPIFYEFCEPNEDYSACTSDDQSIRHSFPSSHASTSFCVATLLTLYIHYRFGAGSRKRFVKTTGNDGEAVWLLDYSPAAGWSRLVSILSLVPMAIALFVACSRIVDNKHFPADVIAGTLLGTTVSGFTHGLWFA